MNCKITYEQLAAYSQADPSAEPQQAIAQHIASCATCHRRLASLRTVDAALRALPAEMPSAETILAVRRLISEETRPRRESDILTLEEVAEFLRINPEEFRPYIEDLPAFELGGQIRVRRSKLLEWIEQRERQFSRGTGRAAARFRPVAPWKGVAL
jgi:hypothetical protein